MNNKKTIEYIVEFQNQSKISGDIKEKTKKLSSVALSNYNNAIKKKYCVEFINLVTKTVKYSKNNHITYLLGSKNTYNRSDISKKLKISIRCVRDIESHLKKFNILSSFGGNYKNVRIWPDSQTEYIEIKDSVLINEKIDSVYQCVIQIGKIKSKKIAELLFMSKKDVLDILVSLIDEGLIVSVYSDGNYYYSNTMKNHQNVNSV